MAEIITKDSEEFKEITGWIKRTGRALEKATARIRPGIADEHYLSGEEVCEKLHISKRTLQALRRREKQFLIPPSPRREVNCSIRKADCTRF